MRRLIFITTVPVTLSAFLLPFARHFRTQGIQIDAMAQGISTSSECVEAFDRVWEVKWSRNPLAPRNFLQAPRVVREVVEREAYGLVHVHTPVAALVTRYALRGLRNRGRLKVVYTAHGFHFYQGGNVVKNAIFLGLEKLAGYWTDYLIVINREDERAAKRYRIVPPNRVRYMPGIGIDLSKYSPRKVQEAEVERVRAELGLKSNQPLFLIIAEFTTDKRHRDAVLAFACTSHPTAHLAFVGTGAQIAKIKTLVQKLGITDRVHFLGFRHDIPALIRASITTVMPSIREGLPRSVMESLSLEVPVIGTDIRGTRDLLQGGCGLLVPVGDVAALTRAMTWILDHPEEARNMGKLGRQQMAAYDLRHIIAQHEALYAEAMEKDHHTFS